ncbi:Hypothetical protein, conserved [Brucella abortus str. 2308 A]|nr:Hypothetical protein, conserved [Brucella abortus str. 2308 A]
MFEDFFDECSFVRRSHAGKSFATSTRARAREGLSVMWRIGFENNQRKSNRAAM